MKEDYVVYWWNAPRFEREWETFSSVEEANSQLVMWKDTYPWNTYFLAKVERIATATKQMPVPIISIVDVRGSGAAEMSEKREFPEWVWILCSIAGIFVGLNLIPASIFCWVELGQYLGWWHP